jgi:hypothetical protein
MRAPEHETLLRALHQVCRKVEMSGKIALPAAALVGAALLTSSLSLAQQPPTPPAAKALEELAVSPAAGTLGVNTKTYSAVVLANATLALGPAGSSSLSLGTGVYQVTFPSDISKCVYTATIGNTPAGAPGPALVSVTPRAGNADAIFVRTFAPNGVSQAAPFHIQVQC